MAIRLPETRLSGAPAPKKRNVPVDAILKVLGNNPFATGIDKTAPALSKALEDRFERRRKGQASEAITKAYGLTPEEVPSGIDPDQAMLLGKYLAEQKKPGLIGIMDETGSVNTMEVPGGYNWLGTMKETVSRPPGGGGVRKPDDFLRAEYLRESEPYKASLQGYNEGKAASSQGTGIGDAALVRAIVKVAEGKGARVSNDDAVAFAQSGNIPQRLNAYWLQAVNGQRLDPTVRAQFVALLDEYYKPAKEGQLRRDDRYRFLAKEKGIRDDLVVGKGLIPSDLTPLPVSGQVPGGEQKKPTHRWNPATGRVEVIQ